jgi:hypothetical protein
MYVNPAVPTYDANSLDRQLMFECKLYYYNLDESVLANYNYDILWEIDDEEFTVKANLAWAEIKTDGRLKSSELTANGTTDMLETMTYPDGLGLGLWCLTPLSTIFQYFFSFIGGGNRSTWRKSPICRKSLTNFIT